MRLESRSLQRYESRAGNRTPQTAETLRPPANVDLLLVGIGNSGEALAARIQALFFHAGCYVPTFGINNDALAPRPLPVRAPDDTQTTLTLTARLVLGGENPRNRLYDYPLLEQRYRSLLRGILVFETYPQAGHGGHGHPVISLLDLDLNVAEVMAFSRQMMRSLSNTRTATTPGSDVQRLLAAQQRHQEAERRKQVVCIGGGAGSMGNAGLQWFAYPLRWTLEEAGIRAYDLWSVVLGPHAFTGLTPFVQQNYRALLHGIDHLARHGQRRRYINDLEIALQTPPYDRVFLMDDPRLPSNGTVSSEAELETFLDETALTLYLLLRGTVWETIAAHTANPHLHALRSDWAAQPRYIHTAQAVLTGTDRSAISAALAAHLEVRLFEALAERLES